MASGPQTTPPSWFGCILHPRRYYGPADCAWNEVGREDAERRASSVTGGSKWWTTPQLRRHIYALVPSHAIDALVPAARLLSHRRIFAYVVPAIPVCNTRRLRITTTRSWVRFDDTQEGRWREWSWTREKLACLCVMSILCADHHEDMRYITASATAAASRSPAPRNAVLVVNCALDACLVLRPPASPAPRLQPLRSRPLQYANQHLPLQVSNRDAFDRCSMCLRGRRLDRVLPRPLGLICSMPRAWRTTGVLRMGGRHEGDWTRTLACFCWCTSRSPPPIGTVVAAFDARGFLRLAARIHGAATPLRPRSLRARVASVGAVPRSCIVSPARIRILVVLDARARDDDEACEMDGDGRAEKLDHFTVGPRVLLRHTHAPDPQRHARSSSRVVMNVGVGGLDEEKLVGWVGHLLFSSAPIPTALVVVCVVKRVLDPWCFLGVGACIHGSHTPTTGACACPRVRTLDRIPDAHPDHGLNDEDVEVDDDATDDEARGGAGVGRSGGDRTREDLLTSSHAWPNCAPADSWLDALALPPWFAAGVN
ncbi:hypothetical protein C8R46DRAFT_1232827 [Mycena filopes]|nr:hypothetical protein C8R46DRAFT_1232827 [Mycena filopes]